MNTKSDQAQASGKCYFCKKEVDKDYFCHGCKQFICDTCDTNIDRGWGAHKPEAHQDDGQ